MGGRRAAAHPDRDIAPSAPSEAAGEPPGAGQAACPARARPSPIEIAEDAHALAAPLPAIDADTPPASQTTTDAPPPIPELPARPPQYPVNPGYWQVDEHWLIFTRTELYCVTAENILKFMMEPCNHIYHCSYHREEVDDGKIRFAGVIRGNQQRYDVSGGGSYSQTRIAVSIAGTGHYKILPVAFAGSLDAHFLSAECPEGARRIRQRS